MYMYTVLIVISIYNESIFMNGSFILCLLFAKLRQCFSNMFSSQIEYDAGVIGVKKKITYILHGRTNLIPESLFFAEATRWTLAQISRE